MIQSLSISLNAFKLRGLKVYAFVPIMNKGLDTSINPFSGRAIAKGSRYYNDISKTSVFNLSVPINTELKNLEPMEINGKGTLHILLRDEEYKMAFEYVFLMGKSMEIDIVVKLLDALKGY